jgi:hypothetical protein
MSYNYSYNVLINRLEAFAAGHFLIKRFTHGQIDMADQMQDDEYPFMHVTPDTIEPVQGGMQFGFHIIFADIPRDKEVKTEYQREVISDCVRLGQDLIAEIRNGLQLFGFNVQLVNNPVFEPFMEEQKNTVTGVAFTIKLEVPWDWSACDIPAIWSTGGESTGGSGEGFGILLQTNSVNNQVQSLLNLVNGTNITIVDNGDGSVTINSTGGGGGGGSVTSVALSLPSPANAALSVSGSPITTSGTFSITANGTALQYIDGTGALKTFPDIPATLNDLIKGTQKGQLIEYDGTAWVVINGLSLDKLTDVSLTTPSNGQVLTYDSTSSKWKAVTPAAGGSVTSVGLSMPAAFSVTGSPVTTSGTLAVTATGTSSEYIDGTGALQTLPSGGIKHGTASGTDTYAVTISGVASYADGDAYLVRFSNGNTTGCTLNINALGAIPLYRNNDGALIGGDIWDGAEMLCIYNSTLAVFQCIGTSPNSLFAYVTNAEASTTITKGQPVYAFGGTGDRLTVKLAYNTSDATSAQTVGMVVSTSIAPNQKGIIIVAGQLDNLSTLPTSTFADGDPVYLGATAGTITNVKPAAPNHLVYLGIVTTASPGNNGRMYVRVQNGYEMNELHDVQSSGAVNNDILYRDTAVNLWKPASIPTILGYTPVTNARTISTTSPLSGGGDLTANRTLSIADAVADGTTKGAATFTASDFNSASGVISLDYTNGQKASAAQPGFLSASDFTLLNRDTFVIRMALINVSPADNTNYYFHDAAFTLSTSATVFRTIFPFACKLVGASITAQNNPATTASNEASTINFRLNNTTDVLLSNAVTFGGTPTVTNVYAVTGLNQAIAANDTAAIKWTTPVWATNPTAASVAVFLYFERS